jgi:predicted phosphodiesterase
MRIAVVSDSHLAPIAEDLLPNWNAAKQFVSRSAVDLTIHLGDRYFKRGRKTMPPTFDTCHSSRANGC